MGLSEFWVVPYQHAYRKYHDGTHRYFIKKILFCFSFLAYLLCSIKLPFSADSNLHNSINAQSTPSSPIIDPPQNQGTPSSATIMGIIYPVLSSFSLPPVTAWLSISLSTNCCVVVLFEFLRRVFFADCCRRLSWTTSQDGWCFQSQRCSVLDSTTFSNCHQW